MVALVLWTSIACRPPGPVEETEADSDPGGDTDVDSDEDGPPILTVDVVVIGSGAGGLGAAWAATRAGASVLVLERAETVGGATRYAANYWAAGTRWQEAAGVTDTPEEAAAEWAGFTGGDGDHPVVQRFVSESASVLEWLEEHGATFSCNGRLYADIGSKGRIHTLSAEAHPVDVLAEELATSLWRSTEAVGLVLRDGAVVGVRIGPREGAEPGWVEAGAVVVATGGFTRNDPRVAAAVPGVEAFPAWYEAHPGMDGNGLDMAQSAGGAVANLHNLGLYAHAVEDANVGAPEVMVVGQLEGSLIVDAAGQRVGDEWDFGSVLMGRRYLDEGPFYAFFDDESWTGITLAGRGFNYVGASDGMQLTGPEYEALVPVASGDDPAEVAASLGIDPTAFSATFSTYADATASGVDAEFGKDVAMLVPLDTPPFRAVPLVLGRAKSFGGLATDEDGAVLDAGGAPIPGLYAAGEAGGFLGGEWMGHGLNGSVTAAWWAGLRAGDSAANR